MITQKYLDELTYKIIGCALDVHKQLGRGCLKVFMKNVLSGNCRCRILNLKPNSGCLYLTKDY